MAEQRSKADRGNDGATARGGGEAQPTRGGGAASLIILPFLAVGTIIGKVWNAITEDGHLAAAARQGADELGAALKAFPESIQTQETGTIWNPTQGEVTASRSQGRHTGRNSSYSASSLPPHPWPSEVANRNRNQPGNDHGHDNGHDEAGHSM
jgi:hypothetical protein